MSMREEHSGSYEPLGKPKYITLHWSAGPYNVTFPHYHFNILGDGSVKQTLSIQYKGSHTWHRNSNNIGVSMSCMFDGKLPPTKKQLDATARCVAELMGIYGISIDAVKDHAFYAKLDDYASLRWDIGKYFDELLPQIKLYRTKLINGEIKNSLQGKVW